jgi:hypothetical protein
MHSKKVWCHIKNVRFLFGFGFLFLLSFTVNAVPTDYLVLSWTQQDGLVSEYHQIVDLPANRSLKSDPDDRYNIELLDGKGQSLGRVCGIL